MEFKVETWDDLWRDGQEIFPVHFEELSLHKDRVPMGIDEAVYAQAEERGLLHVVTAREQGKLVGYYLGLVFPSHPHNKNAGTVSTTDMFYLLPEHRKGGAGAKLLMIAERTLKERGVRKAAISVKLHLSQQALLEKLGWEATDIVLHKFLGD